MTPMRDNVPLLVAAALAIAAHLLAVPALMDLLRGEAGGPGEASAAIHLPDPKDVAPPRERDLVLGQERSMVSSVAWIPYEDFQKLVAPESVTEQPALQEDVEPTPDAPPITDATPPAPQAPETELAKSAAAEPVPTEQVAALPPPTTPLPLPDAERSPEPDLLAANRVGETAPSPETPPTPPTPPTPAPQDAAEPTPAATTAAARPTSAPREPREAGPTQVDPVDIDFRAGRVVTPEGLEIRTYKPQISTIAKVTLPANPRVALTFTPEGDVIKVTFLRSTGAANWDSPIEAALYRWKATGPKLAEIRRPFTREFNILLHHLD